MEAEVETVLVVCAGRCPHCPIVPGVRGITRKRPPSRTHLIDLVPRAEGRWWVVSVYVDGELSGTRLRTRMVRFSARRLPKAWKQARSWAQQQVREAEGRIAVESERAAVRARHEQMRAALAELPPPPSI